jgi:hypothetical protein
MRNYKRRRSIGALTCVDLVVCADGGRWEESTCALSLSAHGVLVALGVSVAIGQAVIVRNPANLPEKHGRIVRLGRGYGHRREVSIEFAETAPEFWFARRLSS